MTVSGHKELNVLSLALLEIAPKGCSSHSIQITYVISEYELFGELQRSLIFALLGELSI